MATKEELLERARELELQGRATMNKAELEEAVGAAEGDTTDADDTPDEEKGAVARGDAVAVDEERVEELKERSVDAEESEELEQERLDAVEDEAGPETRELVTEEMDTRGPLLVQSPADRVMTGAVNEKQAKEQEKLLADPPEGANPHYVTEAGYTEPLAPQTEDDRFQADGVDLRPWGEQVAAKLGYDNDADKSEE